MSMETLVADLKANIAEAKKLSALSSLGEVVSHLNDVLWPTLEAVVEEIVEIDACVEEQTSGMAELIHPESGEVLSAVVAGAVAVSAALKARITKESEPALYKVIEELEKNCVDANDILEEIVLEEEEEEEDDDDEEDNEEIDDEDDHQEGAK